MAARIALVVSFILVALTTACGSRTADSPARPGWAQAAEVVEVWNTTATTERPVFYTYDPSNAHRLIAYDWAGNYRGELRVAASEPFGVYPSADGTMILLTHGHVVSGGEAVGNAALGTWAEDDEHLCTFTSAEETTPTPAGFLINASLFLQSTTAAPREVAHRGLYGRYARPEVLACSVANDRAVITETAIDSQFNTEVIRLSDGAVISYAGGNARQPDRFLASSDGTLLAEGGSADGSDTTIQIRAIPSGEVIATLSGGRVLAFSGDNSRLLTVRYLNGSSEQSKYDVIDVGTGQVVWSKVLSPGAYLTRPNSPELIVAGSVFEEPSPGSSTRRRFTNVWLVPATGSARLILEHSPAIAADRP